MRSRWSYVYFLFYLCLGFVLLFLNNNVEKAIITLVHIITILTPMIGTVFGVMYYYNSREFTELLLAQPIKRNTIFLGQYLGLAVSLSMSLVLGLSIPFAVYGLLNSANPEHFYSLLVTGTLLTFIFVALALRISISTENRIKGFGYAILLWLSMAVLYDGLFMILLIQFNDYPLDTLVLIMASLNPIDLSRIFVILSLDTSALLGYTGKVMQDIFGSSVGTFAALGLMLLWIVLPVWSLLRSARKKDF